MLFRDEKYAHFLRKPIKEEDCIKARNKDHDLKQERTYKLRSPKYRKKDGIREEDEVHIRNYSKPGKSDPTAQKFKSSI